MTAVPVWGHLPDLEQRAARKRAGRSFTGKVPPRVGRVERMESRSWERIAAKDLGGLFIDRLYSHGEDLIDEGARMYGDQEGGRDDG